MVEKSRYKYPHFTTTPLQFQRQAYFVNGKGTLGNIYAPVVKDFL